LCKDSNKKGSRFHFFLERASKACHSVLEECQEGIEYKLPNVAATKPKANKKKPKKAKLNIKLLSQKTVTGV
jgi:hypothetical protein